jgi:hypothetical protein
MFWANANPDIRIDSAIKSSLTPEFFYLPPFTNCYEYDFRNAQALQMLEDAFWESSYPAKGYRKYLKSENNINTGERRRKTVDRYVVNRIYALHNLDRDAGKRALIGPGFEDLSQIGKAYASSVRTRNFVSPASLLRTKDFSIFPITRVTKFAKGSYYNRKQLSTFYSRNSSVLLNLNTTFNYPHSYLSVLNIFQADTYRGFRWCYNSSDNLAESALIEGEAVSPREVSNTSTDVLANFTGSRFSNPIALRGTAKNSIATYSALQKVFRSRLDQGRSNMRMRQFADMRITQPFMTGTRVAFEKLLGKNKESFYNTTFYTDNTFTVFNDLASANNSLNTYFFDFPFLLAAISDPSRSVWFDWWQKWGLVEVGPASEAKLSLVGAVHPKRSYDFNPLDGANLNGEETYFIRIARARKNYLPLWIYTPYLYLRTNSWSRENGMQTLKDEIFESGKVKKDMFSIVDWSWKHMAFTKNTLEYFTPSFSNCQKTSLRPHASIQSYYYNLSVLTDILTRREYLLRQYWERHNKIINLPKMLTVNPDNPLICEIKSSFLLIDPIVFNSEYSRGFLYSSSTFFRYIVAKEWLLRWSASLSRGLHISPAIIHSALGIDGKNGGFVTDSLLWYFLSVDEKKVLGNNQELYRSQYRPLKKGISNMLRLHGSGAVAMPLEIRLQILASSRDVIHSWAVPSAGIKIDCIPGYTSHRIMIFFSPGIYWGQCMEICGRYHHWMPIIVYFMKRDLFFLWCTHFMNPDDLDGVWDINDRQFTDYLRFVSFDRITWLTEIGKGL